MGEKQLKTKEYITIGVFAVIYYAVTFGVGIMGIVPVLFLVYPTVLGIIGGPIVMLLMAKVPKPGAIVLFGMISPILMFVMGHTYVILLHSVVVMAIAELVRKVGNYGSLKYNMISYAVFSTWICGSLMQMLWAKERYIKLSMMMGKDYVQLLEKLITYPHMLLVYIGAFLGGIVGALLGRKLLQKHFSKAGVI